MDSWFNVTIRKHFFTACILMLLCTFVPSFTSAQSQNNGSNTSLNQVTTPSSSFFDFASNLSFERIISPFKNSFNFVVDKTANFIQPIFTISVSNVDNSGTTNGTNNQQNSKTVEPKTNQKNLFNSTSSSLTVTKNYLLQIGAGLEQGSSSNVNNGSQETSSKSYFATLQKDTADIAKAVASSNNVAAQNSSNSNAVIKNILTRVSNLESTPRVVQIINTYPQNNIVSSGGGISVEAFNALSTSVSRALDSFNRNIVTPSIASAVNNFNTNVIGDVFSTSTTRAVLSAGDNLSYDSANGVFSLSTSTVQAMVAGLGQAFSTTTTRNVFSNTVTGLTYSTSTGVTSLTSGYNIPTTASTTEWASTVASIASLNASTTNLSTFYQTPSTRITAGTGLAWSGNTINSTGVTSIGGFTGAVATSSFSTSDFIEGSNLYFTNGRADARANIQIGLATSTIQAMTANSVATSTIRNMFSNTVTGLTFSSGTGITSLTSGYVIPLTASTTEWANKVSSQWLTSGANISYSAGNVGIGTTGPQGKLDVAGQTLIGNGDRTAQSTYPLYISDSSNLGWKVADGSGISKFELYAGFGGTNEMRLLNGVSLIGYGQNLTLGTSQNGSAITILDNASGNVGIGTTTPETKLSVVGAANFTGNVTASAFYGDGSNLTGITSFSTTTTRNVFSNTATGLTYDNSTGVTSLTSGYNIPTTASTTEWANKVSSQWLTSGSNIGYTTGSVGIGTASPGFKTTIAQDMTMDADITAGQLSIQGATTPGKRLLIGYDTNGSGYGFIKSGYLGNTWTPLAIQPNGGGVGIGTAAASITSTLTVSGAGSFLNPTAQINNTTAGGISMSLLAPITASGGSDTNGLLIGKDYSANNNAVISFKYAGSASLSNGLGFGFGGSGGAGELATLLANGNFGIGTTTPGYALTVAGDISFTGALRANGNPGTTGMVLLSNGASAPTWVATSSLGISGGGGSLTGTTGQFAFFSGTNTAVGTSTLFLSNGNIGIGTTTPASALSVVGAGNFTSDLTTRGLLNILGTGTSTVNSDILLSGDIVPSADNTYRLGTPSRMWKDVYIGPGSLYVNGQKVLQTDVSNNVTITADSNQNLVLKSAGTGDLELNPSGTGQILLKGNLRLSAGKTITTSDASPLVLTNGADLGFLRVASNTITPTNLNGGITIAATGTGGVYFTQGNVGIATTSPAYPLTVSGDINFTGALRANGDAGTTGMVLLSNGSSAPTWVATSTLGISSGSSLTGTTGQFAFFSGTNTAVGTSTLFLSNGNIGIGTTTPTARLSISGSAGVTDLLNIASSTSASLFKIGATGATYFNNDAGTTGMVLLSNGTGASPTWMATSSLGISGGGSSQWTTSGSDIYYNTGKVKIGADTNNFLATNFSAGAVTSVPSYSNSGGSGNRTSTVTVSSTLTPGTGTVANLVDGSQAFNLWWSGSVAGSYIRFDFGAGQSKLITEATFYESSAVSQGVWKWQGSNDASTWTDIGSSFTLGATAPQTITELSGNTTGYRYYQLLGISGSTSSGPYIQEFEFKIDNYTSATYAGMQTYTTNGTTAGGSIALQTSGGSVGIGVASPLSKLDINGGVAIGTYAGASAAPGNGLIVSGNVGIGTTTPTAKLAITGTAGTGDIFAVASSTDARLFTVTANGNVGIGTTTPGSSLVVQGSGAFTGKMTLLDTVSSSVGGIYFGSNQFLHNYGTRNTFTGSASGNFTLTGTDNTANGINALGALTSGHSNAALGSNAGNGITSGVRNVAIGYYAIGGGGGSTGNDNVAIGYGVGSATSVTGAGNVGVGMYAIRTLSSGNYNVALGYGAGEAAGTAANNVFVGKAAGSLTTGSNNIMIGYQAGANLVTGTKNIIIGYDISATSSTMTNGLNIGNLIFGTGLDGSATTLSTGKIGIGSTTPYAKLTVAGEAYADLFTAGSTTATSTFAGGLNVGNGALTYNWATGLTNITNASLGAMTFDSDSGMVSWVDMPVTSTSASGTVQSYTAQLDGNPMLSIYGLSDGAGAVNTLRVGVGTTTPVSTFAVAGTINASNLVGGASLSADASGNIILTPSDERLKQDIKPIESALDKLMKLQGVTFDWKDKERFGSSTEIGFIAQDVQKIVPEVIRQGPEYMSLNYANMVALVVEAVKELKNRVDAVLGWFSPSGDRINIKGMVCVDDVCVTKDQFKQMLMNSGSVMVIPQTPTPASAPTTSTTSTETSSSTSASDSLSTPTSDATTTSSDVPPVPEATPTTESAPVTEPAPTSTPTTGSVSTDTPPEESAPTTDSPAQ